MGAFNLPQVCSTALNGVERVGCQKSATGPDLRLGCCGFVLVDHAAED
jgi:hypothetical protein